jgi:hypothetical protein
MTTVVSGNIPSAWATPYSNKAIQHDMKPIILERPFTEFSLEHSQTNEYV